jgi:hypothetical protein
MNKIFQQLKGKTKTLSENFGNLVKEGSLNTKIKSHY